MMMMTHDPNNDYYEEDRSLIVGGQIVTDKEAYPAFVWSGVGPDGWGCGGSRIHTDVIMTAAHCQWVIQGRGVYIGALHSTASAIDGEYYEEEKIVVHPDYDDSKLVYNDIMLVKLKGVNITTTKDEDSDDDDPLLFAYNTDPAVPVNDADVRVIGFGMTEENGGELSPKLRQVDVQVASYETCNRVYNGTIQNPMHLCAGTQQGGKDSCDSDSGSPLFLVNNSNNKRQYVQVGLVGDGIGCGRPATPAIYTRISTYADWIHGTVCDISDFAPNDCATTRIDAAPKATTTTNNAAATGPQLEQPVVVGFEKQEHPAQQERWFHGTTLTGLAFVVVVFVLLGAYKSFRGFHRRKDYNEIPCTIEI